MKGVISSGHQITSEVGARMLKNGGNAFDAAVAACTASCITEPTLTSLGGGGFAIVHDGPTGEDWMLDFFVDMPGLGGDGISKEGFEEVSIDFGGSLEHYYAGIGSAALPGVLPGLLHLHEEGGALPLREVLAPAIELARRGVVITPRQGSFIKLLDIILVLSKESRRVFCKDGAPKKAGDIFVNPDTASFLELFTHGDWRRTLEDEFYGRILDHMERSPGLITSKDVEHYAPVRSEPLSASFLGQQLISNPPPSIGGILIAFILKAIERHDLASLERLGPEYITHFADAQIASVAMRREMMDGHIHDEGLVERVLSPKSIERFTNAPPVTNNSPMLGNTTHLSVTDAHGTAISLTSSNGENAGYVIPGTGIQYNNMLGEGDLNPEGCQTHPVGKRLPSSMSPSIVLDNGNVVAVLGSGGSNRIISAIAQVILNRVVFGLDAVSSVEAPRVHYHRDVLHMEPGFPDTTVKGLRGRFDVSSWKEMNLFFGGVHMTTGNTGGGDPRRAGAVVQVD